MGIYAEIKEQVTARDVAEYYGYRVSRNGMMRCPFHDDRTPSMKIDRNFICFGCQENRMIEAPPLYSSEPIEDVTSAVRVLDRMLKNYDREVFGVINLGTDGRPVNFNIISMGTLNTALVHPREVFKSSILSNAQSMILFHNHPSGNIEPSREDVSVTDRLKQAAEVIGIRLEDHIILGNGAYYSFREKEKIEIEPPSYARTLDELDLSGTAVAEPGTAAMPVMDGDGKSSVIVPRRKPAMTVEDIMGKLENGLKDLFSSEQYKTYLTTMAKFHNYSLNNTLLIAMQKPDASLVAGFNAWKKNFGRHVKKGEKGIRILQPAPYKVRYEQEKRDPATGRAIIGADGKPEREMVEVEKPAFRVASVFDVSQTEGKELPTLGIEELTGHVDQYKRFYQALERTCPIPIRYEQIESGAKGYYSLAEDAITLQENMSQMQTVKTLIHEMAHQRLHSREAVKASGEKKDARTREVEAESIAYAVCQHYGIDTAEYSFAYVAGWAGAREMDALRASLQTIRDTASSMINEISGHLHELERENEIDEKAAETSIIANAEPAKAEPTKGRLTVADHTEPRSVLARLHVTNEERTVPGADRVLSVRSASPER